MKSPAALSMAPAATTWPSHAPPTRDGGATGQPHAEQVQRRQSGDEHHREEPALERRHGRMPVAQVLDEERRIDGHVDEAIEPRPPADLEAPERPEGARRPRHVAALVGHGGGQLRHGERNGQAPEQRREDEENEREAGTERRHRVLDAIGAATHIEEDDGGERQHAELAAEAHLTAAMSAGSSASHASMGRAASTVISSLPFGSRRTRPGAAGPSGMTSDSRWIPSAAVTAESASISFIVTTSSMKADLGRAGGDLPPRLLLDGNALDAARALGAPLRLAGHEDLGGAGRGRGAADPPEQRGHLRVEFGRRQEARGIEGDDERAVRELSLLGAGPARARQDAAEDLDGEREPVALVRAGRQQRARGVAVKLPGIRRRLAARVQHDPRRHLLAAVELHADRKSVV